MMLHDIDTAVAERKKALTGLMSCSAMAINGQMNSLHGVELKAVTRH
jgi:hypothetical protein